MKRKLEVNNLHEASSISSQISERGQCFAHIRVFSHLVMIIQFEKGICLNIWIMIHKAICNLYNLGKAFGRIATYRGKSMKSSRKFLTNYLLAKLSPCLQCLFKHIRITSTKLLH